LKQQKTKEIEIISKLCCSKNKKPS